MITDHENEMRRCSVYACGPLIRLVFSAFARALKPWHSRSGLNQHIACLESLTASRASKKTGPGRG